MSRIQFQVYRRTTEYGVYDSLREAYEEAIKHCEINELPAVSIWAGVDGKFYTEIALIHNYNPEKKWDISLFYT